MPLDVRAGIAHLEEDEIRVLESTMGRYLQYRPNQFNDSGFQQLKNDCASITGAESVGEIDKAQTISRSVWKILRDTHRLRVVR